MSRNFSFEFDDEVVRDAEEILDGIGLDVETFFRMCLKKLNRERNIAFLTSTVENKPQALQQEKVMTEQLEMEEEYMVIASGKQKITPAMRDCIWDIFSAQFKADGKINYPYSKQQAVARTGMNEGSAHVYFLFLNNLMNGKSNTRIVKYDDLVVYLDHIASQFSTTYLQNAIQSLKDSAPYWLARPTLNSYARKVLLLIAKF